MLFLLLNWGSLFLTMGRMQRRMRTWKVLGIRKEQVFKYAFHYWIDNNSTYLRFPLIVLKRTIAKEKGIRLKICEQSERLCKALSIGPLSFHS